MTIKKIDKHLYYAIEQMLQGLCYWMGYRMERYSAHSIMEGAAVDVAVSLLNARIDHTTYVVQMEFPYRRILGSGFKQHADIAILKKANNNSKELEPVCLLEFKMTPIRNKGIWGDIKKMSILPSNISRLAILLSKGNPGILNDFVENKGTTNEYAKRKVESFHNKKCIPVKVLFVKKAMESIKSKSPFRSICVELEDGVASGKTIEQHVRELDEHIQS